jgi:hypothetical protein
MMPRVTVVLPLPLWGAAMTMVCMDNTLLWDADFRG